MKKLTLSILAIAIPMTIYPNMSSAAVIGFLGNFDVINDTGSTAHGFEIDLEGLYASDITDTFGGAGRGFPSGRGFDPLTSVERYGAPSIAEYNNGSSFGTKVTYLGLYNSASSSWDFGTPSGTQITPGDNCWSGGGIGYGASTACDHFGVGTTKNATKTTYNWLLETATLGQLTNGTVSLPAPAWTVTPAHIVAGQPPAPPIVVAQIQAPAPEVEAQFGEAIWVKVYTTELEHEVGLEALIGGNQVINQAEQNVETEWQLLQVDPGNPLSGQLESGYGAPVGPNAASIIRRYEFYKFSGNYNPEDHQAMFDAGFGDSHPGPNDVGTYLGAQNAGINLNGQLVAAIPEPETYALMLAGLGLIGFFARRNKASVVNPNLS